MIDINSLPVSQQECFTHSFRSENLSLDNIKQKYYMLDEVLAKKNSFAMLSINHFTNLIDNVVFLTNKVCFEQDYVPGPSDRRISACYKEYFDSISNGNSEEFALESVGRKPDYREAGPGFVEQVRNAQA